MISNRNRSVENELDTKIENYNQIKENLVYISVTIDHGFI